MMQTIKRCIFQTKKSGKSLFVQSKRQTSGTGESNSAVRSFVEGNDKPALLIELKWDKSAEKAITQIKEKNYTQLVKNWDMMGRFFWLESIIAPKQRNIPV